MPEPKKKIAPQFESEDYKQLVELLAIRSDASIQLATLESNVSGEYLELVDEHREEYSQLQSTITQTDAALEVIAVRHPEWFKDKKSVKTPYGSVKFHASTALQIENEELSAVLIKHEIERTEQTLIHTVGEEARTALITRLEKLRACIRTVEELDKEALEKLEDGELKPFKVSRIPKNNFSVTPLKLDLGKAVKESEQPAEPAAK